MIFSEVHVRKGAVQDAVLAEREAPALADGMVRLAVESFSVTSNNVTYAVVGDGFGYWDFFPAPEGFGIVPMWGHARVIESRCPDIAVGERVYGYLPMASHLDVRAGKITASGFAVSPAITVPANALAVTVGQDGTVTATIPGQTAPQNIGSIQLASFTNPAGLESRGQNIFVETAASGTANANAPGTNGLGTLQQGYLETSNVNVVEELVSMIQTQRAYEINSKAIQTSDQMLARLSQL